ncbi:hypothetical protein C7M84_012089 [Penaeus vannamei]|uniref:Uncharacterized protein n=1 Tax=Penaeus vannamei TaxID=6689 RepID=A0A423SZI1_PENVA|nr:hypothetical protein C7M84_012089 [Penaeus vannamei]
MRPNFTAATRHRVNALFLERAWKRHSLGRLRKSRRASSSRGREGREQFGPSGQTHALADAQRRSKPPPGLSIARPERGSHVSQAGGHPAPPQRRPGPQGAFLTHSCSLVSYTPMPRSVRPVLSLSSFSHSSSRLSERRDYYYGEHRALGCDDRNAASSAGRWGRARRPRAADATEASAVQPPPPGPEIAEAESADTPSSPSSQRDQPYNRSPPPPAHSEPRRPSLPVRAARTNTRARSTQGRPATRARGAGPQEGLRARGSRGSGISRTRLEALAIDTNAILPRMPQGAVIGPAGEASPARPAPSHPRLQFCDTFTDWKGGGLASPSNAEELPLLSPLSSKCLCTLPLPGHRSPPPLAPRHRQGRARWRPCHASEGRRLLLGVCTLLTPKHPRRRTDPPIDNKGQTAWHYNDGEREGSRGAITIHNLAFASGWGREGREATQDAALAPRVFKSHLTKKTWHLQPRLQGLSLVTSHIKWRSRLMHGIA